MTDFKSDYLDLRLGDCMEGMKGFPDNHFDLAIVDPPYGIGIDGAIHIRKPDRPSTWAMNEKYVQKSWDSESPNQMYWDQMFRISENQIVWGANYFTDHLPRSKGWIFWDKLFDKTNNFSHGELAWTSFQKQLLKFTQSSKAETNGGKTRIHPTQKPVKLYKWLLKNYAESGQKILDTHLGSMSIAIACHDYKCHLTGFEIDEDYFKAGTERVQNHVNQLQLFR